MNICITIGDEFSPQKISLLNLSIAILPLNPDYQDNCRDTTIWKRAVLDKVCFVGVQLVTRSISKK